MENFIFCAVYYNFHTRFEGRQTHTISNSTPSNRSPTHLLMSAFSQPKQLFLTKIDSELQNAVEKGLFKACVSILSFSKIKNNYSLHTGRK